MSCTVPVIAMDLFRDRLGSRARADRVPLTADIEIIATCNFDCKHCYIAPGAERDDIMSLAKTERLFDMLVEAGTLTVLLTGGEVLTHKQFGEIYLAAKRRGLLVGVNSNAYLIGERWADFFAEWPPLGISISLYGMSDQRYEDVTGIPNAFRRVMRALDLLDERNIAYELKCPAMSLTADEIPAMYEFAKARGRTFRYDPIISPHEKGSMKPIGYQLAPDVVVALEEELDPGWTMSLQAHAGKVRPNDGSVYNCGAGLIGLHVNVHGGVTTCLTSRQEVGNIFEQGFAQVWDALGGKVAKRFPDGHPCASCKFRQVCMGCPATVEQLAGLPEGYVQDYCKMTHLKAFKLGLHPTGVPRTVVEGIPAHVRVPVAGRRMLPVLS